MLQEAAARDLSDYFEFLIGEAREELGGAPEGGSRHPVETRMDGRQFARFHVDIEIGDEVLDPLDVVEGLDWLAFGGMATPAFPAISREQQFAEKVHAFSLPRGDRMNTRNKDLIDMILLVRQEKLDKTRVKRALGATFAKRGTHDVPENLEPPPEEWRPVFASLAEECGLEVSLSEGFEMVRSFLAKIRER
jgi:hypothetical protein